MCVTWLSVTRPSSRICSSRLKTSTCAFSTSSNSTTQYGRRRTCKHHHRRAYITLSAQVDANWVPQMLLLLPPAPLPTAKQACVFKNQRYLDAICVSYTPGSYLLCELSSLVKANIARWCSNQLGYRVLLHVLRHVQTHLQHNSKAQHAQRER